MTTSVDQPPTSIPTHRAGIEFAEVGAFGPVPLATVGDRLLARLIDQLIIGIPAVLLAIFLLPEFTSRWSALATVLGVLALAFVYEAAMIGARGATLGKQVAGIEVVAAATGARPGAGRALIRTMIILGVSVVPPLGALAIVASTLRDEDRRRGWHDRAAGTIVIASR